MKRYSGIAFAGLLWATCLLASAGQQEPSKVSKPFEYAGYTSPQYTACAVSQAYVPTPDGEELAVDMYVPADAPQGTRFPVIFQYTPYRRSTIDPKTGEVRDLLSSGTASYFTSYGYAMVRADMRGTGASTGWLMDFIPELWRDGKTIVDWIAAQPWCDGNVGMMGSSYLGWSQTAAASQQPEALKCIMPAVIPLDGYTGEVYPGGIYLQIFLKSWSEWMYPVQRNYYLPDEGILPTKPVVDEDGDGELADEIPLDQNGNGTFLDDGFPPKYGDNAEREHIYYKATAAHKKNLDYDSWASKSFFIDAKSPLEYTMYDLSPSGQSQGVMASGIPVYNLGGWFDGFTRGSFELYCTWKGSNPSKLSMLPAYHSLTDGPFWQHFGHDIEEVREGFLEEHLRFFDRYLKGIENGIDAEPPICLYIMNGGGWRMEREWPLARAEQQRLFFDAGKALRPERRESGEDTYTVDYSHNSSYGENQGNRWIGIGGNEPKTPPSRTNMASQCLVYTSEALGQDREVTGHPIVTMWVSSTEKYGDFFVYLEDVAPDGESLLVTEGMLRAGFAGLRDNDRMIRGGTSGIDVLPELPWHGYEKSDYEDAILANGNIVSLVIDMAPTSWVFRKGHRVRVSIAGSDYPSFRLHPKLSPANDPADEATIAPSITVYRDVERSSHILLPVIPGSVPGGS